jgi:hypothetical protein
VTRELAHEPLGWRPTTLVNVRRYSARRTLHTGAGLLADKQAARLTAVFADDAHVEVEATWGIYQRMIAAYRGVKPGVRGSDSTGLREARKRIKLLEQQNELAADRVLSQQREVDRLAVTGAAPRVWRRS